MDYERESRTLAFRRKWHAVHARWRRYRWPITVIIATTALAFGLIGWGQLTVDGHRISIPDRLYNSVILFAFDTPYIPLPRMENLPAALQVARWLAPLTTILAGLGAIRAIFSERLTHLRIRFLYRNHVVVCGLGRSGIRFAISFHEKYPVVAIDNAPTPAELEECNDRAIPVLIGDASDRLVLSRARIARARHAVVVCGGDGTNLQVALRASTIERSNKRLFNCYVNINDEELSRQLERRAVAHSDQRPVRFRYFNLSREGPRAFLDLHRSIIDSDQIPHPHIIVAGSGAFAINLIVEAARRWWLDHHSEGRALPITMVAPDASDKRAKIHRSYPTFVASCDLRIHSADLSDPLAPMVDFFGRDAPTPNPTSAIICIDDDAVELRATIRLQHELGNTIPILVCTTGSTDSAGFLKLTSPESRSGLDSFPLLDNICTPEVLFNNDALEHLAQTIHAQYVRQMNASGFTTGSRSSVVEWQDLSEEYRESNRRQVADFPEKLGVIGYEIRPTDNWDERPHEFGEKHVEELAHLEHIRWMNEKFFNGWTLGPRDEDRKMHPNLVPWDQLDEEEQEKDLAPMRSYPKILADHGYVIVPRPAGEDSFEAMIERIEVGHLREMLGRKIHEAYVKEREAEGDLQVGDPALASWGVLPEALRESNRMQADDIANKLRAIGYLLSPVSASHGPVVEFSEIQVEELAKMEHERWMTERLDAGWKLGPRDTAKRRSPYLVPWEDLTEEIRERDRQPVRSYPQLVADANLAIVPRESGPEDISK
jgi:hypothetical protein